MTTHRRQPFRLASGLAAAGLLLVPLTGCSDQSVDDATSALDTAAESPAGEETSEATETSDSATPSESADATSAQTGVDCSGSSCSVTLAGEGAEVDVFGTTVTLGQLQDGRATVGVAGQEISCSEGEGVSAGPLSLECTTITDGSITMTATLG
ncbi:hypothetical protein [Modestobacter roseus]|uniref:Secreted protein n=1 Tax=Modestobacter roseus TaxID=1181884 RepID=A0A562IL33_9ACTN|nr:hypothetical protein [Modestobacter roseus]MQA32156.1 hypothetical protein [Modestobacter roseus]TWH71650.1 hypothetical protein JD78_00148 [Modestobacter roseus]